MRAAGLLSPVAEDSTVRLGAAADALLRHVPRMEIDFDGDCAQAIGADVPVVAINLRHRPDRWQLLTRRMAAVGIDKLIRAPAIEGARVPRGQIAALLRSPADLAERAPPGHLTLTPPAVGCFLSHLAVWRWMLDTGLPRLLVLEDDAVPTAQFDAARFRRVIGALSNEVALVFPGCLVMAGLADRAGGAHLARLYYFNGTFAYLITPGACWTLLRHLLPLHAHIDHQISKVLIEQRHVLAAYCAEPSLFEPDWSLRSDCYVPLADERTADRELGEIIASTRRMLLSEGRPLREA